VFLTVNQTVSYLVTVVFFFLFLVWRCWWQPWRCPY